MKGFLKELQESNATGAVQVVRTLSGSVKQPELDGYADKEIFSVHGKGKLLWADEIPEAGRRDTGGAGNADGAGAGDFGDSNQCGLSGLHEGIRDLKGEIAL